MRRVAGRNAALGLVLLVLVACGGSLPTTHYYVLNLQTAGPFPRTGDLTIGIVPFVIEPPYDQDRIVYRIGRDSVEVHFYNYHRWAAPLSQMLPEVVAEGLTLESAGIYLEPVSHDSTYIALLEGRLIALEEVDVAEGQMARVSLSLTLEDDSGTTLWAETVDGEAVIQAKDVGAMVEQFRDILKTGLVEARTGLAAALSE